MINSNPILSGLNMTLSDAEEHYGSYTLVASNIATDPSRASDEYLEMLRADRDRASKKVRELEAMIALVITVLNK